MNLKTLESNSRNNLKVAEALTALSLTKVLSLNPL